MPFSAAIEGSLADGCGNLRGGLRTSPALAFGDQTAQDHPNWNAAPRQGLLIVGGNSLGPFVVSLENDSGRRFDGHRANGLQARGGPPTGSGRTVEENLPQ